MLSKVLENRRIRLIWFAATRANSAVSLPHLLSNTIGPTADMFASKTILRIEKDIETNRVFFKGRADPLYFPAQIPRHALNMVLGEARPWHWHYYEIPETLVREQDVVFDCGAAEGYFSFSIAPRTQKIFAFEPLPGFAKCLRLTFASRENVIVVPVGISDRCGTAFIKEAGLASEITAEESTQAVEIQTIDSFCAKTGVFPTYIKADVEGFERKLILGAKETIQRYKPKIAITTYHVKGDAEALASTIKSLNPDYNLKFKGLEHHRGDPLMLQAW